jgi:hypothetical protein
MINLNTRRYLFPLITVLLISLISKWHFAQWSVFDFDIVPVVSLGWRWLHGAGDFPVFGTLSSVGAYNLPGLPWLHLPFLWLSDDPHLAIILTLTTFNLLGICAIWRLGSRLFAPHVGFASAVLFAFCDTSLAGSTIAWAQLLLPTFFVGVLWCLYEWRWTGKGVWLAGSGIIATFAFMVHFSAILLFPLMLLFALIMRPTWRWRGFLAGSAVCVALLAPYLAFQVSRDFNDIRAFIGRTPQVSVPSDITPMPTIGTTPTLETAPPPIAITQTETVLAPRNLLQRVIDFVTRIPTEVVYFFSQLLLFANRLTPQTPLYTLNLALYSVVLFSFTLGVTTAFMRVWQTRRLVWRWRVFSDSYEGQLLVLLGLMLVAIGMMMVLRVSPIQQPTYMVGFQSWVLLISVWSLTKAIGFIQTSVMNLPEKTSLLAFVVVYAFVCVLTRDLRYRANDRLFPQVWYYDTVHEVVNWIAEDWQDAQAPTIAYDILREQPDMKWVLAWHSVSTDYRMGMSFDFLLYAYHGINNANQNADGLADQPDYIVVYDDGLARYDTAQYTQHSIGRVVILTPRE